MLISDNSLGLKVMVWVSWLIWILAIGAALTFFFLAALLFIPFRITGHWERREEAEDEGELQVQGVGGVIKTRLTYAQNVGIALHVYLHRLKVYVHRLDDKKYDRDVAKVKPPDESTSGETDGQKSSRDAFSPKNFLQGIEKANRWRSAFPWSKMAQLFRRSIRDLQIEIEGTYGFDEPDTTGYLCALSHALGVSSHPNISLQPQFSGAACQGKVAFSLFFSFFGFLTGLAAILWHKPLRDLWLRELGWANTN